MARRTFVIKGKRDRTVTISYGQELEGASVYLDRESLGIIKNAADLETECLFVASDQTEVRIHLDKRRFGSSLVVTINGKQVKEWRGSPFKRFIWAYRVLFFFGIYHIVFGIVSGTVRHDKWEHILFASIMVAVGVVYIVLGTCAKKLSLMPFVLATALYLAETIAEISLEIHADNAPDPPAYIWRLIWLSFLIGGIHAVRQMKMDDREFVAEHVLPYY